MKRIVDGKRYDTETATEIAKDHFGNPGDYGAYHETLYITKNGTWFLAGGGGALSRYAERRGPHEWSGSSTIIPLVPSEAREWLEAVGDVDALERHFSGELEDA